jgi:hypothetical protein
VAIVDTIPASPPAMILISGVIGSPGFEISCVCRASCRVVRVVCASREDECVSQV